MHNLPVSTESKITDFPVAMLSQPERRDQQRLRTVYRVARVTANGDQGLAKVRNLSDGGIMLSLSLPACPGTPIVIELAEGCSLQGTIVWRDGDYCGVKLGDPIDSAKTLKRLYQERYAGDYRPLRLPFGKTVAITCEDGTQFVRLRDISQSGMKIVHSGGFTPGLPIKILLAGELERRGIVRWSRDGVAGIWLTENLSVADLGSLRALSGADF
ncbi:PilZ domain-containing protein [Sphingopyxis sp. R3-92]|uniref:PilZ domain-containing protein n=1 Tax=Sphingopyxis sp. R3-92 TaxID=3158553 RepID=UPI003EE77EB1